MTQLHGGGLSAQSDSRQAGAKFLIGPVISDGVLFYPNRDRIAATITSLSDPIPGRQLGAAKGAYVKSQGLDGAIIWTIAEGYTATAPTGQRDPLMQAVKAAFLN